MTSVEDCHVQVKTCMRTSIENGDAEMLRILINAKANFDNRDKNVSACIYGIVGCLRGVCTKGPTMF